MNRTLAIVLTAAIVGGAAGAVIGAALGDGNSGSTTGASPPDAIVQTATTTATAGSSGGLTPEEIYRHGAPGVVVITATQTQEVPATAFTPALKERVGILGSGFVIDRRGDIVTNDHVVQGTSDVRVGFDGGATYPARIVGTDPATDVAVVRVRAPGSALHPLGFDTSGSLSVGDPVYAIGNPFGLDRTMTAGIVSALGRDIQAPDGLTIPNAVQTDAPINHGNSGGPLLDRYGRVVGIDAQIEGGSVDGNVGVGFAIPSSTARSVAAQLIAHGRAQHAWLGVEAESIDPEVAGVVRGLPSRGVVIARVVAGSPAAKAGLQAGRRHVTVNGVGTMLGGDVIVSVNGTPLSSSSQLSGIVAEHRPGETLTLGVARGGAFRIVRVILGELPGG